jgi:pimeloyl-ACP methyl ester carboxylesterase
MGIRDRDGEPVPIDLATSAAFPGATGRLVVLVHGLVETERCWRGNPTEPGLAETLEADSDLTPVSIRYNTGLRISTNGSHLATLLEEIYSSWPVAVESFALVGHSMGGLVVRSACVAARESGHRWIDTVTDVVTLGSPHAGAPLERGVNAAAWGLSMAAETRPLADFLNARSAGIKDLRYGAIAETDWRDIDPDELLTDTVDDHPLPPAIDHHFVAGVITADPTHPVGVAVGDLIVPAASGTGKQRFEPANAVVIGGMRHRDLLREPAVIDHVMAWLAPEAVADRDSASA